TGSDTTDSRYADIDGETYTYYWDASADGITYDTRVRIRVYVYDGDDTGTDTTNYFSVDIVSPDTPQNVHAIADLTTPETGVYIYWEPGTESDSKEYRIYRSTNGVSWVLYDTTAKNDTDFLDSYVQQGDSYFYKITLIDIYDNESDSSVELSAPYMYLTKTKDIDSTRPGDTILYTIRVFNTGFAPANGFIAYDYRPENTTLSDSATSDLAGTIIEYKVGADYQSAYSSSATIVRWKYESNVYPHITNVVATLTMEVRVE
ncbi:MAG: hypothetical protein AB1765_11570, partial [Candidatus Hydrogenedentota bacterium]